MIARSNIVLSDNYSDSNTFISLSATVIALQIFNNPATIQLFKRNPGGGHDYEPVQEQTFAPGFLTIQQCVGFKAKNGVAGSISRIYFTIPEYDPNSPDPIVAGYTPTTQSVSSSGGVTPVSVPSGVIVAFGGSSVPSGWVLCDGSSYDGTTPNFISLWGAIGLTYGGSGQSSFKVPDAQGRMLVGKGTNAANNTLGLNDGVALANRRQQHRHTGHSHSVSGGGNLVIARAGSASLGLGSDQDQGSLAAADGGSGNANDSLDSPAYIVINYIISL